MPIIAWLRPPNGYPRNPSAGELQPYDVAGLAMPFGQRELGKFRAEAFVD
jgi:hypothetical protein